MDTKKTSMIKSVLWRAIGVAFLAVITFIITGSWVTSAMITFTHHAAFIVIYFLHEQAWVRAGGWASRKRRLAKVFTYEIVLGHVVLGIISMAFTGSWVATTNITLLYIENKLWMYVLYDYAWDRFLRGGGMSSRREGGNDRRNRRR